MICRSSIVVMKFIVFSEQTPKGLWNFMNGHTKHKTANEISVYIFIIFNFLYRGSELVLFPACAKTQIALF